MKVEMELKIEGVHSGRVNCGEQEDLKTPLV